MLAPLKSGKIPGKPLEFIVMSKTTDNRYLIFSLALALVIALSLGVGISIGRGMDDKKPELAAREPEQTAAQSEPEPKSESESESRPPADVAPPVLAPAVEPAPAPAYNPVYQNQVYPEPPYYHTTVSGYPITEPTPYVYSNPPMDPPSTYGRKIGPTP